MAARVCVLGSANLDLVVYTDRLPRAGETVTGKRFATVPGGKGLNQAVAAARAGAEVRMGGAVGADPYGDQLLATLARAGVDTSAMERVAETTGTAHITVDETGENSIIVIPGANGTVHRPGPALLAALDGAALLLVQLELPVTAVTAAARAAHERGVRVVLTPAPVVPLPIELLGAVDLLVPNQHELTELTGITDVDAAASALLADVPELVVTLGRAGSAWYRRGHDKVDGASKADRVDKVVVPGRRVPVRDTTAAGDTFVGVLAARLAAGAAMREALEWATAAAALSVQVNGASTSMPGKGEIEAFLRSDSDSDTMTGCRRR